MANLLIFSWYELRELFYTNAFSNKKKSSTEIYVEFLTNIQKIQRKNNGKTHHKTPNW